MYNYISIFNLLQENSDEYAAFYKDSEGIDVLDGKETDIQNENSTTTQVADQDKPGNATFSTDKESDLLKTANNIDTRLFTGSSLLNDFTSIYVCFMDQFNLKKLSYLGNKYIYVYMYET